MRYLNQQLLVYPQLQVLLNQYHQYLQTLQFNQQNIVQNYNDYKNLIHFIYHQIQETFTQYNTTQLAEHLRLMRKLIICHLTYVQQQQPDYIYFDLLTHVLPNHGQHLIKQRSYYTYTSKLMSAFAEFAIEIISNQTYQTLKERYGAPINANQEPLEFMVFAMGKLGGYELNVSSDIDLVFLYDAPEDLYSQTIQNNSCSLSHHEFFEKLGQKLIQTLNKQTDLGQVFRVDMRLRPYGDIGSVVTSIQLFEEYLISQGRAWERFAWLKARQIYGKTNTALKECIEKFVYRRYLDYSLITSLKDVHQQILKQQFKQQDRHIKLGHGGIREIEFLVQLHQLLYAGQRPHLRGNQTLHGLQMLKVEGLLTKQLSDDLALIYQYYRDIEHTLQYLDDQHTHLLPDFNPNNFNHEQNSSQNAYGDWQLISQLMHQSPEQIHQMIQQYKQLVHHAFMQLFEQNTQADQLNRIDLSDFNIGSNLYIYLDKHQIAQSGQIVSHIQHILNGARYRLLSDAAQQEFLTVLCKMLETVCQRNQSCLQKIEQQTAQALNLALDANKQIEVIQQHTQRILMRCLDFLHAISQRRAYLSVLVQYPKVIGRLIDILSYSVWSANYLIQHPYIMDELLQGIDSIEFDWPFFNQRLARQLSHLVETEQQMDSLRQNYNSEVFKILLCEIYQKHTILETADQLSALTDSILEQTMQMVWKTIEMNQNAPLQPKFCIIAYGKLGGKELSYASDLDLIFIYDDDESYLQSYLFLARKMTTWLTSTTRAGKLFDIDTRLRPNGQAGILVSSLQSFKDYQLQKMANSAWTWEHQALSRARFCAGMPEIGEKFEEIRQTVLQQTRDIGQLKNDIYSMRQKMLQEKANFKHKFSLKYSFGGMIDIEFIVQFFILAYASKHIELTENLGNYNLIGILQQLNFIDQEACQSLQKAYLFYRKKQYEYRLNQLKPVIDLEELAPFEAHIHAVQTVWLRLFGGI